MNSIRYIVKKSGLNNPTIISGDIDYKAALIINRGMRFKIAGKIHSVNEVKFTISSTSKTSLTIYI
jgi:hypothetical protein